VTATDQREPVTQPRLGVLGGVRYVWRQLTSMRTALLLLLLLAIAAVPGSVLPQRRIDPGRVSSYFDEHPTLAPWLDRIGGFDVYAAPWFAAIYLLLFVSLVGCVLPRSRQHLDAIRARPPRTPRRLERMPAHLRLESDLAPDQALAAARAALRGHRFRIAEFDESDAGAAAAAGAGGKPGTAANAGAASRAGEKGHVSETGNLLFHLALLGVLVAVAVGSLYGFSGQTLVITGREFANTVVRYSSFHAGTRVDPGDLPPFSLRLDDLQVRFEEQDTENLGAPRDFRATVTAQESPDAPARRTVLRVNQPLTLDGARVFLVGNGYAVRVTVRDASGQVAYSGAVPLLVSDSDYTSNGAIKVPDIKPAQLGFPVLLLPTAQLVGGRPVSVFPDLRNPRLLLSAYSGDLGLDSGAPQSVFQVDQRRMKPVLEPDGKRFGAVLAPGGTATLPGGLGSLTFDGVTRYAALDVRSDPGKGWALGSALLALAGLVLSLFVRRRRVWVRVRPGADGGSVLEVAGLARRDDPRLQPEVEELARRIDPGARPPAGTGKDDDRSRTGEESVRTPAGGARE
jgi:cytochrome c biogenesis protein